MSAHDPSPFYSADNLATDVYDAITELHIAGSSVEGDVTFYRAVAARTGGPILDVGCGTGRVASVLASDGLEVVGMDLSEPMLRVARRRRTSLAAEVAGRMSFVCADMTDFDLDRTFVLLLVPFRAFQFLHTVEAQRSALASMRRHLAPGGELVLDLFDPRLDLCVPLTEPVPSRVDTVIHPTTGRDVRVERLERKNDLVAQVLTEIWRTTEVDEAGRELRSVDETLSLRWTYRWEMRHLLELSGLEVIAEYGDFKGSPPAYGREQVWVTRSAG